MPTTGFVQHFLKSSPELKVKKSQPINFERAKVTREDLINWHNDIRHNMTKEGRMAQLENPSLVYNWDETGFIPNRKDFIGIFRKSAKRNHSIANGAPHGHITVLFSVSADGCYQTPMILYKGKQRLEATMEEARSLGFGARKSDSGYMTTKDLSYYMEHIFVPSQQQKGLHGPFTVFLDNAASHLAAEIIWKARELNITFLSYFPNSTDVSQVLDLTVFKRLKDVAGNVILNDFPDVTISNRNFANVLKKVLDKEFPTNLPNRLVIKGFKDTGCFPFESNNMQFDMLFAQEPSRLVVSKSEANISQVDSVNYTPASNSDNEIHSEELENLTIENFPHQNNESMVNISLF